MLIPLCLVSCLLAQSQQKVFLGPGLGLDYGGLGLKAEVQPLKNLGFFAGGGYNLVDLAYNAGLSFKMMTNKNLQPVIVGMYGYNGVIKIQKRPDLSRTYYGFTAGTGVEIYDRRNKLTFHLLVPFRRKEFKEWHDELEEMGYEFKTGVIPFTITVGYNILLTKGKQ